MIFISYTALQLSFLKRYRFVTQIQTTEVQIKFGKSYNLMDNFIFVDVRIYPVLCYFHFQILYTLG